MKRWRVRWKEGQTNDSKDKKTDRIGKQTDRLTERFLNGEVDECKDERQCMHLERKVGQTNRWMNGWMDELIDGNGLKGINDKMPGWNNG